MTENAQNARHPLTTIKLRGHRKRRIAQAILQKYPIKLSDPTASSRDVIKVVCISDTHNHQPELPAGDILIHAGDLTDNGSFEEVQAGLRWLSSQPHRCKIFAAGNHDVLLDEDFLKKYRERRYGDTRTKEDLVWGRCYLPTRFPCNTGIPFPEGIQSGCGGGKFTHHAKAHHLRQPVDTAIWHLVLPIPTDQRIALVRSDRLTKAGYPHHARPAKIIPRQTGFLPSGVCVSYRASCAGEAAAGCVWAHPRSVWEGGCCAGRYEVGS